MSLTDSLLKRRDIVTEVIRHMAYRTMALIVGVGFLYYITGPGRAIPYISQALSFLYTPAIAGTLFLYLSSLVPVLFEGRMAGALRNALMAMAVTLFIAVLMSSGDANAYALPVLLAGGAVTLYLLAAAYSDTARILSRTLLLAATGACVWMVSGQAESTAAALVGWMALVGFMAGAIVSLGGLLARHGNASIASAGKALSGSGGLLLASLAFFVFLAYVYFLRPGLAASWGGNLVIAEWLALLALLAIAGYRVWGFSKAVSEERKFGDLRTLVQKISYDKKHLEPASSVINGFVDGGKKEGLIVYIARVMLDNGASPGAIEDVISGIVGYRGDPEPPIMLRWAAGDTADRNRKRRLGVVSQAVSAAAGAVSPGPGPACDETAKEAAPPAEEKVITIT